MHQIVKQVHREDAEQVSVIRLNRQWWIARKHRTEKGWEESQYAGCQVQRRHNQ
jgi:hypothetical protein